MANAVSPDWDRALAALATVDTDELGKYTPELGTLTNAVSFAILVLTMVGAAGMMVSMLTKEYTAGKGSTVRSRMVLFLVFGDFWLGLIGVIPTLATLTHNPPREGTGFCNSMGYLLAVSVYVQHLNTLTLCVSTFLILTQPLSKATRLLERHWRWLLPLPWIIAAVLGGIAWGTQGDWGYNNGVCFYKPGLFSELWQFIPRCIVFSVISVLYVRLFVFLRRPDKIRSSTSLQGGSGSSTTGGQTSNPSSGSGLWSRWRYIGRNSSGLRASTSGDRRRWGGFATSAHHGHSSDGSNHGGPRREREASTAGGPKDLSMRNAPSQRAAVALDSGLDSALSSSGSGANNREIPAWERLELPDYSRGLVETHSPPPLPRTQRQSVSGWKWGMGASKSFGGIDGVDRVDHSDEPVPSQQPRRSTLAPLRIPHPAPPTQPALRRNSSVINPSSSSRRPSAHGSTETEGDGRLLDFAFASLRRGSHVSFAEHPTPTTPITARASTPPLPPTMSQTIGGSDPTQGLPSASGAYTFPAPSSSSSQPFLGFSSASQGATARASLLPTPAETGEMSPSTAAHSPFSDTTAGNGVDPVDAAPAPDVPPIVFSGDVPETSSAGNSATNTSETRRDSAATTSDKELEAKRQPLDPREEGVSPGQCEDGRAQDDESDGQEYSLSKILEISAPSADFDYYRSMDGSRGVSMAATRGLGSTGEVGSGTGSGSDGKNQESMSKFMNRKASLLMLTFPLAYVILFTVSLIRIISDFAQPAPIPALSAVSRWLVFSQGLVDAFIYGIIEWRVKRTVRRRTRKLQSASHDDSRGGVTGTGSFGGTANRASQSTVAGKPRPSRGVSSMP